MARYVFTCTNPDCDVRVFEVDEPICMDRTYDTRPCPVCDADGVRLYNHSTAPNIDFKGLGFYTTDLDYERQLARAEVIAENASVNRAIRTTEADPLSEDTAFFDALDTGDYDVDKYREKRALAGKPIPLATLPGNEVKTSTNVGTAPVIDASGMMKIAQ